MAVPSGFVAIVGLQAALIAVAAVAMGAFRDAPAAWSTLAGGAACWVPSALFAGHLWLTMRTRPEHLAIVFFVGEFAKILMTVLMLLLIGRLYTTIFWPGLLLGLMVAVKANWLALLLRR